MFYCRLLTINPACRAHQYPKNVSKMQPPLFFLSLICVLYVATEASRRSTSYNALLYTFMRAGLGTGTFFFLFLENLSMLWSGFLPIQLDKKFTRALSSHLTQYIAELSSWIKDECSSHTISSYCVCSWNI